MYAQYKKKLIKMTWIVRGTIARVLLTLLAILVPLVGNLVGIIGGRERLQVYLRGYDRLNVFVLRTLLAVTVRYRFDAKLDRNDLRNAIILSRHESWVDIFLFTAHVPRVIFVMSHKIARMPIFGWCARLAGNITVHNDLRAPRKAVASILAAIPQVAQALQRKYTVVVFPEGTRRTGTKDLGPLGAATLRLCKVARQAGVPVIPCWIHSSACGKDMWSAKQHDTVVTVTFGPPLERCQTVEDVSSALRSLQ